MWLVGVDGIFGCGCKEAYRFPHIYYQELIREGASNCMERHLNLIDSNTFLIWTYPQVGHKCCYHSQCIKVGIHYAAL